MTLIDTHTHLYDERLAADADQVPRAVAAGVTKLYMPNCDSSTIQPMLDIEAAWPEHCFSMMGLHPCYVKENYKDELAIVAEWLVKRPFAAVGEIGLDYYWDKTFVSQQKEAFAYQIDLALKYDLAIIIHSRESTQDCIDMVREQQNGKLRGIFHCFSGTMDEAKQVHELGLHLGIGGVVTYKTSNLPEILQEMPLEAVVLETDAPYLAPVPYRGKRNESAYIPFIAQKIADVKRVSLETLADITTKNAEKIFGK
jgi:TatD DNase family protein